MYDVSIQGVDESMINDIFLLLLFLSGNCNITSFYLDRGATMKQGTGDKTYCCCMRMVLPC